MPLSSSSIIHFTKTSESILGILENNFKLFYCREKIFFSDGPVDFRVPMVSFCDIPLSEIKDHISKYGRYGIGLTKEWAERKGLNPLLYVVKNSNLAQSFRSAFLGHASKNDGDGLIDLVRYFKNYEGPLARQDVSLPRYRFSDEREWRYVPKPDADCNMFLLENSSVEEVQSANKKLESLRLTFEPNDIKYIIIQSDDEIPMFVEFLKRVKGKYSYADVERLTTRILTAEQIFDDI